MPVPANQLEAAGAFARRLRALRHRQGITQIDAARSVGVRVATWRRWEHGRALPLATRISSIASALGVPVHALYVPEGWAAIGAVHVCPETLERVRREGRA